ncbi:AAA family ATPase [Microbacterium sp.]|uniref:AAA family ATPase n=1 Tax=Microbacterium sp. TaxID=51671 RepID=UPI0039E3E3CE
MRILVTGPAGSGTALIGAALAARLHGRFVDGAELREAPRRVRDPLLVEAEGRAAQARWLDAVAVALAAGTATVVASPLLTRPERDRLRQAVAGLHVVELVADSQTATRTRRLTRRQRRRLAAAPPAPVDEPLTADERGVRIADDADLESIVARIDGALRGAQSLR